VHGVRPSSVSNLSAQPPRFAMRSLVWPSQPRLLSWGDVVRSMVLEGTVWRPHSLHTAEVTGSIPVTPTSTNALHEPRCDVCCQQIASKPPIVVAIPLKALPCLGILRTSMSLGNEPASALSGVIRTPPLGSSSGAGGRRGVYVDLLVPPT
jgi:hypothetical protein